MRWHGCFLFILLLTLQVLVLGCNSEETETTVDVPDPSATPIANSSLSFLFPNLESGTDHVCFLQSEDRAYCWGKNYHGQAFLPEEDNYVLSPNEITVFSNIGNVSLSRDYSCMLIVDGTVYCMGSNSYSGTLGDGTNDSYPTPQLISVTDVTGAAALSAGSHSACVLMPDQTVQCWGNVGSLGLGISGDIVTATELTGLTDVEQIAVANYRNNTCALLTSGQIKCWGFNDYGQLGNGATNGSFVNYMVDVVDIDNATQIAMGSSFSCARLSDGTVKCWGLNDYGQLGDNSTTDSNTPIAVSGLENVVAVEAGWRSACALLEDGSVKCWGYNGLGQLGNGTNNNSLTPVSVSNIVTAVDLAVGSSHVCVLLADDAVFCWGDNNNGELGNGTQTDSNIPVQVVFE